VWGLCGKKGTASLPLETHARGKRNLSEKGQPERREGLKEIKGKSRENYCKIL